MPNESAWPFGSCRATIRRRLTRCCRRAAVGEEAIAAEGSLDAEVAERVRLDAGTDVHEPPAALALKLHEASAGPGARAAPDQHPRAALVHHDRKPVRLISRLLPAAREPKPALEAAPANEGRAGTPGVVIEEVLRIALQPAVAIGELLALVDYLRLASQASALKRIRRVRLDAELGVVDGQVRRDPAGAGREVQALAPCA